MGEIITLQFGNFANYVGTHYWNIQERNYEYSDANGIEHEIQSSLLWRADERDNGTLKYTPRTIIMDLKDAKGPLSKEGCVVREQQRNPQISTWNANTTTIAAEASINTPSFDFTELLQKNPNEPPPSPSIEYWSEFLGLDFHSNSIFECSEYKFGIDAFDKYSDGQALLENLQEMEDFEDKVRKFMEESNSPQGFQIFANTHDGFGAVARGILEKLNDEYSKPSITFGVSPSHFDPEGADMHHMINTSLNLSGLSEASTIYVPVVMDWEHFANRLKTHKEETLYHSSAVIAASIDTATLNFRSFTRTGDFTKMLSSLSPISEWNISTLLTSFPFEISSLIAKNEPVNYHAFLPLYTASKVLGQTLSIRGGPSNAKEFLETLRVAPERFYNSVVVAQPFDAPKTFPCLLYQKPFFPKCVSAQLQTTKSIYPYLASLTESFTRLKPVAHKYPNVDYSESFESLSSISEGYAN